MDRLPETEKSEFQNFKDDVTREAGKSRIPIFVAVLAAALALISMANDNASKLAQRAHIEASNQFSYFQAKNIRATDAEIAAALFARLNHPDEAAIWASKSARYTSEKADILKTAHAEQTTREMNLQRSGYFSVAIALLQIAIVLATVALVARSTLLIVGSALLAVVSLLYAVNGHGLYVHVPSDPVVIWELLHAAARGALARMF